MNHFTHAVFAVLCMSALLSGCADVPDPYLGEDEPYVPPVDDDMTPEPETAADVTLTFDHPAELGAMVVSPREALERMQREGPPVFSSRVHGCRKMRYDTLGTVLASRGVDLASEEPTSAGAMYRSADQALGAPNYAGRVPEATELTVASSSRLFDILVQAAPEILANLPSREECFERGAGVTFLDAAGRCSEPGLTCLLGETATPEHVALCNDTISRAATPEEGQRIAVASLLAAQFTCE